ncbi:MAG: hypothetical protein IJ403_10755 [Oscillospiraceae bacterium]|nr:hypothetical protein [Oscillospiraceae bacterium]
MNKIHRYISFFLCLALIVFCLSPVRAYAAVVPDPAYSSAYIVIGDIVVEGIQEGSKVIASALASVWNKVFSAELLQTAQGVLEIGSFFSGDAYHKATYDSYAEGELSAGQVVLTKAFLSSVAAAYKTKTGLTLSEPTEDVVIYAPPESVWMDAEQITADRLNFKGFADLTEVNQNILAGNQIVWQLKKDLNGLELFLRTTNLEAIQDAFASLESTFTSQISALNSTILIARDTLVSKLGSLETSIDTLSSTLHTDLTQLKSSYASFGNETLDKLDTLNTSIQNITLSDLSADFVSLRETITQYDSLILTAVQDLPDQISQSLTNFYETQSQLLISISDKLGQESSYLADLVGENQLIRDELSAGFSDTLVALDELEVNVDLDFQPVIDQILSTEMTLNDSLNSLYTAIESLEVDMTADFQPVIDQIIESEAILSEPLIYLDQFNWDVIYPSLESILSSFGSVQTSLDSINDQVLYGLDTSIGALRAALTNEFSFLKLRITDLFSSLDKSLTTQLTDIKTAVQTIAGTTTADPGIGDDDSQDEADKQMIPLIPYINNGFQQGENYIGNVYTFLEDELEGFRVAALIFEEFAGISFFYKLIITSCSVGLIATLLGMTLYAQSFNLWTRRREEAAQVRAQYRMQRSNAA